MSGIQDNLKNMGPGRFVAIGGVLIAIVFFFIFLTMRMSNTDMSLLYANLSQSDVVAISTKLQAADITYSVAEDNQRILVSNKDVGRARMLLAEEGLPASGSVGYEIFDNESGFGTTDFVQNINNVRALEGELNRTISTLDPILSSRIHIVLPKRELFSREAQPATASVFLRMRGGQTLAKLSLIHI